MRETLREKISRMGRLQRLPRLDRVACGMLSVSVIIDIVIFIMAVVMSVYTFCEAMGDSNGGGWLIFILGVLWIVFAPIWLGFFVKVILWKKGMDKSIVGQWKAARDLWMINGIGGIAINVFLILCVWNPDELEAVIWIFAVGVIYYSVIIVLLKISDKRNKNDMKKRYKAVLFDFDYTLGDSTDGIVKSIAYALEQLGEQPQELENIRKTIGMTLKEAYRTLTGNMDEERAVSFETYFKQKADEVMVDGTNLYEPTRQVMESLREQGCKIGIVTTKYHYRIDAILAKFGMSHMVDVIVGGDDVKKQKPEPDGLFHAMKSLGIADEEILYVGDTVIDAKAAKSAGVDFGAVLTGTTQEFEFATYPKKVVAKDLRGLMSFLRDENKILGEYEM